LGFLEFRVKTGANSSFEDASKNFIKDFEERDGAVVFLEGWIAFFEYGDDFGLELFWGYVLVDPPVVEQG